MVIAYVFVWVALVVGGEGKRVVQSRTSGADEAPDLVSDPPERTFEEIKRFWQKDDEFQSSEDDFPQVQYTEGPALLSDEYGEYSLDWVRSRAKHLCNEGDFKEAKGKLVGDELSCGACVKGAVLINGPPPMPVAVKKEWFLSVKNHCSLLQDKEKQHNVIIIRHGQSLWNKHLDDALNKLTAVAKQIDGTNAKWNDSPLSQFGLRQSQKFADILNQASQTAYVGGVPDYANVKDETAYGEREKAEARFALQEAGSLKKYEVPDIVHKFSNGTSVNVSDEEMVRFLHSHPGQLDVLLGRKCSETNFVTSQLTRAMDTFQIVMLAARENCPMKWEIDSDMQEFEHNADCRASTAVHETPGCRQNQAEEYYQNRMTSSLQYVSERYDNSDVTRFTSNLGQKDNTDVKKDMDRSRFKVAGNGRAHKQMITNVLERTFKSLADGKKNTVFGGHSIWFRRMLRWFGDQSDPICKELGKVKIANVGAASFTLRKLDDRDTPYAATECKWVHMGSSKDFKYKPRPHPVRLQLHPLDVSHKHYRPAVPKELKRERTSEQMLSDEARAKRGAGMWKLGDSCKVQDTPNTRAFFSDSIGASVKIGEATTRVSEEDGSSYQIYAVDGFDYQLYEDDIQPEDQA